MDKKEEFKSFVKKNPILTKYIKDGTMTWQKFYEIYDIYGEDNNAWDTYISPIAQAASVSSIADIMGFIKNIDLDNIQNGINSIQRVVGVFQDLANNKPAKSEYKPRPTYKHFED